MLTDFLADEEGIFGVLRYRVRRAVDAREDTAKRPEYPLLFDPQTSGGLLASVPPDKTDACVNALRASGCATAAITGSVTDRRNDAAAIVVG